MAAVPTTPAADLRRRYAAAGLAEADLAATWPEQLRRWLDDAAAAGVAEPTAMTLATVDPDGRPSARTVLLKGVDERGLTFFTNHTSRKGRALAADPRVALVLPWPAVGRQVCVTGDAEQLDAADSAAYARSRPRGSQIGAWASRQSRVIAGRAELEDRRAELERRFAGGPVPVPPFWGGYLVRPVTVEFWQARPDRLHDRLQFRRPDAVPGLASDGGWIVERLAP